MSGLTAAGFEKKTFAQIVDEMEIEARGLWGNDVDLTEFSPIGKFIQLMANRVATGWENDEDLYYSPLINTSTGVTLDGVVALGGISRRPATRSVVDLTISGTNGTVVASGFEAQTPQGVKFVTTENGTIAGGSVDVAARSVDNGITTNQPAGTIVEINTPLTGVDSVTNAADSAGGADIETDAVLRARYLARGSVGGSTAVAIQSALNNVESIVTAVVYENNTSSVVDGMPPKSIEAVIDGGTEPEILDILLNFKPAGIEPHGTESGSITDNEGVLRTFKWSEPTEQDVSIKVDITPGAEWEFGFVDAVKQKVIEHVGGTDADTVVWPGQGIGSTVFAWRIIAELKPLVGIDNVNVLVGESAPATLLEILMGRAERGITDLTDIEVNVL